jgi:hypothetical protein
MFITFTFSHLCIPTDEKRGICAASILLILSLTSNARIRGVAVTLYGYTKV